MNQNLTAYCGLCCADCIPSDEELFHLVDALDKKLAGIQFGLYAEYKTERIPEFKEYPVFLSVLRRIGQLHCSTCRQGGRKSAMCDQAVCTEQEVEWLLGV